MKEITWLKKNRPRGRGDFKIADHVAGQAVRYIAMLNAANARHAVIAKLADAGTQFMQVPTISID